MLLAEKITLENRVLALSTLRVSHGPEPVAAVPAAASLPTTPAPSPTPAPLPAPAVTEPPIAQPATARADKADRATEKAWLKELERERDDLRKRVAALTRQVEDR